jgi:hypothetical protein
MCFDFHRCQKPGFAPDAAEAQGCAAFDPRANQTPLPQQATALRGDADSLKRITFHFQQKTQNHNSQHAYGIHADPERCQGSTNSPGNRTFTAKLAGLRLRGPWAGLLKTGAKDP